MERNFNNRDALKAYLKKESSRLGISIQHSYDYFFGRNFLQKISMLQESTILIKGSFVQFVHLKEIVRPTTDLDLISVGDSDKDLETLMKICDTNFEDGIGYKITSKRFNEKTGMIQMNFMGNFDNVNHPVNVDLGVKNIFVYENQYKRIPKLMKTDEDFYFNTPSHEEHLAEKICIVVENNVVDTNYTRLKDFYDIYKLHGGEYDAQKLTMYFDKHLKNRGKITKEQADFTFLNPEFIKNHQQLWNKMSNKYEFLDREISLEGVTYYVRSVINEQLKQIRDKETYKVNKLGKI